ncbi:leucine-rich repeats and immunoglobulin-like domains protein 2 isoform X2 [Cylas formicarius]|nr:leucine-rich repeats and immunoglobulin-like domains protein 2 isoform X2 [Cylas formicarius]XP_060516186.1 leucine-rich repeats and immunoglobulin-like domains protein 2 isoform X2 [Cylas formicarius]
MLDSNHIKVISKSWLYGLESLKDLSLSHNDIIQIHDDAWEFCHTLSVLDLSFNKLGSINEDTFKNLAGLQKLALNNNNITYIKDKAFIHLPKLKILNLSNNKISWAIEDASGVFQGLTDLVRFYIAGNNIKTINANAFLGLRNLTLINLANNNITSIQNNAFNKVPLLKQLIMNTTSLLCDCNLKWFLEWYSLKGFKLQAICAYPEWLRGHSLASVPLKNLTCDELPKPRLVEEPDLEIMALKGENVTLSCKAMSSSSSNMMFVWKKDNVELSNSDVTVMSRTDPDGKSMETSSQLNLPHVDNSHAGKYQCVVSNSYGTTYSQKSTISVLVYPTFSKKPKNVTVQAGQKAKLECAATGEPQPEIAWHKDGGNDFPAARERRMHVPSDDIFLIMDTKPSDMGVYSCTAHNIAGTVVANVSLTIEEKPSFGKEMEDKEITAGEDLVLQCVARGLPKPTITWLKDGEPIVPTERHFFTAENQLVIIVDSIQNDSGVYECRLNNSLGDESGISKIVIKPSASIGEIISEAFDTTNMMGIIIITVVSCAILTSIIWVVIIYQTRRRMVVPPVGNELPELIDKGHTHQELGIHCPDNLSDHSSCKDSGTGDSAKRSNDDLVPEEFLMIASGDAVMNSSHIPLLHYPRSTNHDRVGGEAETSMAATARDV